MGKLITILLIIQIPNNTAIDSLKKVYQQAGSDFELFQTTFELASEYSTVNLDSMLKYSQLSIEHALEYKDDSIIAKSYSLAGNALLYKGNLDLALNHYTKGASYIDKTIYPMTIAGLNNNIAIILLRQEEYDRALEYFKEVESLMLLADKDSYQYAVQISALYSNMGAIYETIGEPKLALEYYHKALSIAIKHDITDRVATVYSNIGNLHLHEGNYELSEVNFNQALTIYDSLNDQRGTARMLSHLGELYSVRGDNPLAIETLKRSIKLGEEAGDGFVHLYASKGLHGVYAEEEDYKNAYLMLLEHKALNDSIFNVNKLSEMSRIEAEHRFQEERQMLQSEKKFQQLLAMALGGGFISVLLLFILAVSNYRSKSKVQKLHSENLAITNDRLTEQLEHKNKELTTNVMYLLKKNEFINTVSDRLLAMKAKFKRENQQEVNKIILDLQHATEEDVWHEFETHFNMVHSDFYDNLLRENPQLSLNERKLCAFIRLNLTTKEICAITYQSPNTLQVARTRLRKKLNLDSNEQLYSYLQQF